MRRPINLTLFFLLWIPSIGSLTGVLPLWQFVYGHIVGDIPAGFLLSLFLVTGSIVLAICIAIGLLLLQKTGLSIPIFAAFTEKRTIPLSAFNGIFLGLLCGLGLAVLFVILDGFGNYILHIQGRPTLPVIPEILSPQWMSNVVFPSERYIIPSVLSGVLFALYGALAEEVIARLFLMTFIVWLLAKKLTVSQPIEKPMLMGSAIFLAAGISILIHFPIDSSLGFSMPLLAGILFGWLYWKRGLESAMVAHFTAYAFLFAALWFF